MNLTCRTCRQSKPEDEYYKASGNKTGREGWCKECAKAHRSAYMNQWKTGTLPDYPDCEVCGEKVHHRSARFCRKEACQLVKKREKWRKASQRSQEKKRDERAALHAATPLPNCKHCGNQLSRYTASYCSAPECRKAQSRSPEAVAKRKQWFEEHAELRREYNRKNKAKRRALRKAAISDDVTWTGIMERDHWTCQLCGSHMDPDVKAPDPKSPTWDHIVPLSEGGDHTWANLQACCYGCNSRKSNRGEPQQLALI